MSQRPLGQGWDKVGQDRRFSHGEFAKNAYFTACSATFMPVGQLGRGTGAATWVLFELVKNIP